MSLLAEVRALLKKLVGPLVKKLHSWSSSGQRRHCSDLIKYWQVRGSLVLGGVKQKLVSAALHSVPCSNPSSPQLRLAES